MSLIATPIYTAEGQILIEKEPNILSFEDVLQIESFKDDYYQTQYKLLLSRALAANTIDRMRLYEKESFVKDIVNGKRLSAESLNNDPNLRRALIDRFLGRLDVRPVSKTRLVAASFDDPDPKLAADALNALFETYIEMSIERKYQASEQATDFLANQIKTLQGEIEANETKLQEYGKEKNIVALSSTENTVVEKLGELNKALTDAQIDRVNKETYFNEIRLATPDNIPDVMSNAAIARLREEYNRLYRDYVKTSEKFLPDYPQVQSLKAELDQAKKTLEDETQGLIRRASAEYQAAVSREQALAGEFEKQKREAFRLNSNAIQYNSLTIQIQNEKNLLDSLMKRKNETDVSSRMKGLRTSTISIVDRAEIPASPSSPRKAKNMFLGLIVGLFAGLGLAVLLEKLDVTVKDVDDVREYSGMPVMGMVPIFARNGFGQGYGEDLGNQAVEGESKKPVWLRFLERARAAAGRSEDDREWNDGEPLELVVHFSPKSSFSEYFRSIRTTLMFSTGDAGPQVLGFMSALPQEGKTATVCNLGVALAQAGKRVVIIDADLRRPRLHKIFQVKNLNGLTKYLTADLATEDLLRPTPIPNLFLINAGPLPPNPLELLGSEKAAKLINELKGRFDFILLDTPPILAVSDALALGPRLNGAILVVKWGGTPREALRLVREKMASHRISGLGVIINSVRLRGPNEYYNKSYYEYYRRSDR